MKKKYYLFLMFFAILGVSANSQNFDAISVAQGTNNPVYYNSPEAIPACGYVQPTVGFENGYPSIIGSSSSADDIVIAANDCWTINTVTFEAWTNTTITAADITFMDNNSGNPSAISNGGTAQAISCPFVATLIGTNFGYNIYEVVCTLPTPITLCAGVSPTNFWLSCQGTSSATLYWGFQTAVPYNLTGKYTTTPLTAPWTNNSYHFVFKLNANSITTNQNITICNGDSIAIGTSTYNSNGNYADTLVSSCSTDSIVNTNLTVLSTKTGTVSNAICNGDSIIVNSTVYNASNLTGVEIFTNVGPNSCDSTVTVNLTLNTVDVSVTSASPIFTANATSATYQWVDCNNNYAVINGETNVSYTATVNGNYAVIVTQNGCTDTSACINVTGVGINEANGLSGVNIYPNPTNDIINVSLENITTVVNFTLTSIDGKVVYQANNVNDNKVVIDISNNAKGVYFLKIETNNQQNIYKVIKQ